MKRSNDIWKGVILDSSIWIAYLSPSDSQHDKAVKQLQTLGDAHYLVPDYVLGEVVSVLKNMRDVATAMRFLDSVMESDGASILPMGDWLGSIAHEFRAYSASGLSFVDCALVALSREYTIHTFDKELARIIKKR